MEIALHFMVGLYPVVCPAGSSSECKSCRCKPIHKTIKLQAGRRFSVYFFRLSVRTCACSARRRCTKMRSSVRRSEFWWHPLRECLLGLECWCVAQALLSFVSDCHGDGGAGGFGAGGRGLWASGATPRWHCGYHVAASRYNANIGTQRNRSPGKLTGTLFGDSRSGFPPRCRNGCLGATHYNETPPCGSGLSYILYVLYHG